MKGKLILSKHLKHVEKEGEEEKREEESLTDHQLLRASHQTKQI